MCVYTHVYQRLTSGCFSIALFLRFSEVGSRTGPAPLSSRLDWLASEHLSSTCLSLQSRIVRGRAWLFCGCWGSVLRALVPSAEPYLWSCVYTPTPQQGLESKSKCIFSEGSTNVFHSLRPDPGEGGLYILRAWELESGWLLQFPHVTLGHGYAVRAQRALITGTVFSQAI